MIPDLGAVWLGDDRYRFRVWATLSERVHLHIVAPGDRVVCMEPRQRGYHSAVVEGVETDTRYVYRLSNAKVCPDPVSRCQPDGVHGPSQVVRPHFEWHDDHWFGLPIENYIIYELHPGAFTPEGTFDAIIPYL